jgi:hypothetical protein
MATKDARKSNSERTYLRTQLMSGKSIKGTDLSDARLAELWPKLLDLQITSVRPGRAVALLDIEYMTEHRHFRVTLDAARNSGSSTDAPRGLGDAEVAAIGTWLEKHRADTPAGAVELRATEDVLPGAYCGGRSPLICWFPPKLRESLGPSCAPGNPIQPPELDPRLVSWHSLFSRHPRPP